MSLYGVEPWTRNADPFGVYFGLFASLAPLTRRDGVLYARLPVTGAVGLDPVPGTVALLLCAIGITAFDGGSEGPLFNSVAPDLQDLFSRWERARAARSSSRSASGSWSPSR